VRLFSSRPNYAEMFAEMEQAETDEASARFDLLVRVAVTCSG
jgi:hypothetical protein